MYSLLSTGDWVTRCNWKTNGNLNTASIPTIDRSTGIGLEESKPSLIPLHWRHDTFEITDTFPVSPFLILFGNILSGL